MQPGDRFVGAFVRPQPIGTQFTEWPLHVTVVSWVRGSASTQELEQALAAELGDFRPFEARVGEETLFVNGTVLVNLIQVPSQFEKLLPLVKSAEDTIGLTFVSTVHPVYKFHVTVQKAERLHEGDSFQVNQLSIVEQKGGYKEVVGEVQLGA